MDTNKTVYLFDPDRTFFFAKVSEEFPDKAYDEIWAYYLKNCHGVDCAADYKLASDAIKARKGGWCSVADMVEAGFTDYGDRMVPENVVDAIAARHTHYPRYPVPDLEYRDAW